VTKILHTKKQDFMNELKFVLETISDSIRLRCDEIFWLPGSESHTRHS